jgi:putative hydrolase of the HAD superfamily
MRWRRIVGSTLAGVNDPEICFRELFEHFAQPTSWRINPEAAPVIDSLRDRGVILGIGSNYDARLWPVLGGFPALARLGERTVISSEVGYRKPAREFFREVVRLAECEAGEVLFIGDDRANDYEGATEAGLRAILVGGAGTAPPSGHEIDSLQALLD